MTKKKAYNRAVKLVSDSSVPPQLFGFTYLVEAVLIKSECYTITLTDIYKQVAQIHHCTHRAVTRSIAYAISHADTLHVFLEICKNDLFNGKVIALLALKLNNSKDND